MNSLKEIKASISAYKSMGNLVEVYEEMAAKTMKEIREGILASRDYYHGLARLSAEVGTDLTDVAQPKKNKEAIVLISADSGLYGEIVEKVFSQFLIEIKANKTADVYILGKVGAQLMKTLAPQVKFTLMSSPKYVDMKELTKEFYLYKKVQVFFGQFESLVRQNPVFRTLSSAAIEWQKNEWAGDIETSLRYIYEPSPEKISEVFSQQIFSGILEQTIKEDELSKNASRLIHLDEAYANIEKKLSGDMGNYRKLLKKLSNKKQQMRLVGYRVIKGRRNTYA